MKKLFALSALLLLPACSIFEKDNSDEIVFDTVLGPETEAQIATLPATLEGDTENARYMASERKGQGMESTDGTED